jgi:hypothetical protein
VVRVVSLLEIYMWLGRLDLGRFRLGWARYRTQRGRLGISIVENLT